MGKPEIVDEFKKMEAGYKGDGSENNDDMTEDSDARERRTWLAIIPIASLAILGLVFYILYIFLWS